MLEQVQLNGERSCLASREQLRSSAGCCYWSASCCWAVPRFPGGS